MSDLELLKRKLDREQRARKQAETLIEQKSRELYEANQELARFNAELEQRVAEATADIRASNEMLEQRVRELAALNRVADAMNSVIELDRLLETIMDVAKDVMNAEAGSLLLLNKETGQLEFQVASGPSGEKLRTLTIDAGRGIAGQVAQSGKAVRISDAYSDPRFDPSYDQQTGFRTKSILAAPIEVKEDIVGVVEVINKVQHEAFDDQDLQLFQSFASSAGIALENSRLFEQTKAMAEDLRGALEQERRLSIEKEKMGAYIPKHVVDEISRNREQKLALGGKSIHATIMFSDIQGFTAISEVLEPQKVVDFLNVFMTAMTHIIQDEQGIVDKFMGDGIMAIFIPADDDDNEALRAVQAAICMQRRLTELCDDWKETQSEVSQLNMRIGINTGEVVAGNIGSETRMDYTVVGDNVNVAARIEPICRAGEVCISESTHQKVRTSIDADKLDPVQVKNRIQPIQTYSIAIR